MSRLLFSVVESWFNETRKGTAYCSPVQPSEDSGNLVLHDKHKKWSFYARSSPVMQGKTALHHRMIEAEPPKPSPDVYFSISLSDGITHH